MKKNLAAILGLIAASLLTFSCAAEEGGGEEGGTPAENTEGTGDGN